MRRSHPCEEAPRHCSQCSPCCSPWGRYPGRGRPVPGRHRRAELQPDLGPERHRLHAHRPPDHRGQRQRHPGPPAFRLQCSSTDGTTGASGPHVCTFKFGDGQGAPEDAFWIFSGGSYGKDLTGESKTGTDELWVGSWHSLSAGVSYRVKVQDFYASFSGGPVGSFHTLESLTWTKPIRRPNGLSDLNAVFGARCTSPDNDGRAFFPWANDNPAGGYIYFHSKLTGIVANVRHRNDIDNKDGAYNRAVWGYACRQIAGSSNWSPPSWGVAIDINSVRNALGDTNWDGVGSNGTNYGTYLPDLFTQSLIGNFHWGLNFSGRKDPMHFQYVTGY